jgi:hypothetical protein
LVDAAADTCADPRFVREADVLQRNPFHNTPQNKTSVRKLSMGRAFDPLQAQEKY